MMYNFDTLKEFDSLLDAFNLLNCALPDDSEKEVSINGTKILLNKKDGKINIEITKEETYDDSDIKTTIANYKRNIEELDDCLFLNAFDEMKDTIDVKEFDSLLKQDSFTEEEADKVYNYIDVSSDIICSHLKNKITDLTELYEKF